MLQSDEDDGDDSSEKDDCDGKGYGCPSKTGKTDDDYDDDSERFDDTFTSDDCDGNSDSCPSKSKMNRLEGSCNSK
ncbi:hypothetical protein AVEN_241402-1 [Araneus ventricosus]|uniref:Uncharacterized protein n=1 Tax=Araneus ventricosus TaxID=182803 RepID=A0A4Y2M667_ARAVE|nr:hypothetical protein AVEN_241402-1 [Araneus ventricosus]